MKQPVTWHLADDLPAFANDRAHKTVFHPDLVRRGSHSTALRAAFFLPPVTERATTHSTVKICLPLTVPLAVISVSRD